LENKAKSSRKRRWTCISVDSTILDCCSNASAKQFAQFHQNVFRFNQSIALNCKILNRFRLVLANRLRPRLVVWASGCILSSCSIDFIPSSVRLENRLQDSRRLARWGDYFCRDQCEGSVIRFCTEQCQGLLHVLQRALSRWCARNNPWCLFCLLSCTVFCLCLSLLLVMSVNICNVPCCTRNSH